MSEMYIVSLYSVHMTFYSIHFNEEYFYDEMTSKHVFALYLMLILMQIKHTLWWYIIV